jgi:hypothetical protein
MVGLDHGNITGLDTHMDTRNPIAAMRATWRMSARAEASADARRNHSDLCPFRIMVAT